LKQALWNRILGALDGIANAHSTSPVPLDQSVSAFRVSLVMVGIAFTLTGLYTGSELATSLGLPTGIRASVLGAIVLTAMSVPAAVVGARTAAQLAEVLSARPLSARAAAFLDRGSALLAGPAGS